MYILSPQLSYWGKPSFATESLYVHHTWTWQSSQVIPICAGWFGETNKYLRKIIQHMAREMALAVGDDGIKISSLIYTDKKEEPTSPSCCNNLRFNWANEVSVVCSNAIKRAKLKLARARLHYVPATAAEATYTCRANHSSDRKWNLRQNGRASWYSLFSTVFWRHAPLKARRIWDFWTDEQFWNVDMTFSVCTERCAQGYNIFGFTCTYVLIHKYRGNIKTNGTFSVAINGLHRYQYRYGATYFVLCCPCIGIDISVQDH